MSNVPIKRRLLTIANNIPEICKKLFTKKTVSGSTVFVSDVNCIEHNLEVSLTSDTITDFSGLTVSRYGKNLIPHIGTMTTQWNGMTVSYDEEADTYTINGTCTGFGNAILSNGFYFPVTDSTLRMGVDIISGSYTSAGSTDSGGGAKIAFAIFKYGSYDVYWANRIMVTGSINAPKTLIAAPYVGFGGYICTLYIQCWDKGCVFDNFTFRIYTDRTTSTGYERYTEPQTATSDAEGVVRGLTSLSPNITLIADNNDINIQCSYRYGDNKINSDKFIKLKNSFENAKGTLGKL